MEEKKVIPTLFENWKRKKLVKKQEEIEELKLEIEKAKLQNELNNIKGVK